MAHTCHALGCEVEVKPELLMCRKHWGMVPAKLKREVWKHYRAGQCDDKRPSKEWRQAANEAIIAVAEKEPPPAPLRRSGVKLYCELPEGYSAWALLGDGRVVAANSAKPTMLFDPKKGIWEELKIESVKEFKIKFEKDRLIYAGAPPKA